MKRALAADHARERCWALLRLALSFLQVFVTLEPVLSAPGLRVRATFAGHPN